MDVNPISYPSQTSLPTFQAVPTVTTGGAVRVTACICNFSYELKYESYHRCGQKQEVT